jgi:hypothetical protein
MADQPQHDQDNVYIGGLAVRHRQAELGWCCGCGSRLVTRWHEEEPHWRTVCFADPSHPVDEFKRAPGIFQEARVRLARMEAAEVLRHLPEDVRASLEA